MDADELFGPDTGLGQIRDRQGRGIGGENTIGANGGFDLCRHLGLDIGILKHGLNHQIAARKRGVIGGGGDARQNLGLLVGRHLAALDALVQDPLGMGAAARRRLVRGINQHTSIPALAAT